MTMMPLLQMTNLSIGYDKTLVSNVNLEVGRGEVIAVLGPSGLGKTTLLRTIAGLVTPLEGEVILNVNRRGGLGYIPQRLGLVRHSSVWTNVGLGAMVSGLNRLQREEIIAESIIKMGLEDKIKEPVRRLSGGQQRRVATARTLAQSPPLILADEFLGELDDDNVELVMASVLELVKKGSTLIMVEHHEERAIEFADRIWRIVDGKLVEE
ncbi:MAG TPA: ATP-binding cassette domain-containing protein [Candidatus Poseidoniales archaeon]|nr:ATP-binding cassette domain-containing protein [Candidatus Poseidoniales archaeon]HIL65942.1 ATP-binding cassette domain-containing protein [Candidatus Poseidoniales archaeon]